MRFERSTDVVTLNALLNHPRIRPHMGAEGYLDGAPLLENGFMYLSDHGGMLFHGDDGILEGHYLFTERGCYGTALAMVEQCVLEIGFRALWGRIGLINRAARLFTRRLGFTSLGIRQRPFPAELFIWKRALELHR